ncbi:MAG: GWxTD domain-containing protein [Candidatus Aminicenantes bacterium]|nr:GWxTD domain-containing protein [Candidatus Aminicenantes bacterium]
MSEISSISDGRLNIIKKYIIILFISLLAFPLEVSSGVKSEGKLPPRFKKWLEQEVCYIITPLEKEVFLQLQTDRERDLFIQAFWKHRDPTSGTPENEFKEEHYRRINYANHNFGRAVPSLAGKPIGEGSISFLVNPGESITTPAELRYTTLKSGFIKV